MDPLELAFAGIARQAELIAAGEVSSRELVEVYLERIARLNPQLNAIRVVFAERALAESDQADGRRGAGDRRPLLGVPFLVKDDIDVAGEPTTYGTRAFGGPAEADAEIVRRLRAAGAVILGKTLTPELCIWPFTESVTYGLTRNPWSTERVPGGSSGGSAAAVAAGLVGAALGSDGGGSIRIPGAWCGLVGLKTQRGRVPAAPRREPWHRLSVFGVLARSVTDVALFHEATAAGPSDMDTPSPPPADLPRAALEGAQSPKRLRIAVSTRVPGGLLAPLSRAGREAVTETVELLRSLGHEVRERELDYGPLVLPVFNVRYLAGIHDDAAAMAHPRRLERRTRRMAAAGGRLPASAVGWTHAREPQIAARINAIFDDHDVVLTPATATPPPPVASFEGRPWLWTFLGVSRQVPYSFPWNVIGQPACSVPAGFDGDGLPRAVQLAGRRDDEATLVALAAQIEAARPWAATRPALAT